MVLIIQVSSVTAEDAPGDTPGLSLIQARPTSAAEKAIWKSYRVAVARGSGQVKDHRLKSQSGTHGFQSALLVPVSVLNSGPVTITSRLHPRNPLPTRLPTLALTVSVVNITTTGVFAKDAAILFYSLFCFTLYFTLELKPFHSCQSYFKSKPSRTND